MPVEYGRTDGRVAKWFMALSIREREDVMRRRVFALVGTLILTAAVSWAIPSDAHSTQAVPHPAAATPPSTTLPATRTFPPDSGMLNVTDYGANGQDSVDDTAAIQKAITAAIHHLTGRPVSSTFQRARTS